jgi:hypothetical protein
MAHTGFTCTDGKQVLYPHWVADGCQQVADFLVRVYLFIHIPNSEYIIQTYSKVGI